MKNKLEKEIVLACNNHLVEDAFDGGSKGRVEKKNSEKGKWVSLNILTLRKTKIWQD